MEKSLNESQNVNRKRLENQFCNVPSINRCHKFAINISPSKKQISSISSEVSLSLGENNNDLLQKSILSS